MVKNGFFNKSKNFVFETYVELEYFLALTQYYYFRQN